MSDQSVVVRNFEDNPIQTWEITQEYWYVVTDSLVGGYALANTRVQYTDELDYNAGEFEVCNALFKEIGEHIAYEHNSRLQDVIFETYYTNLSCQPGFVVDMTSRFD
jgi:hypothetical protein